VYGPQGLLGVAPGRIQLLRGDEPILLTFKADNHRARTHQVIPSKDDSIAVKLMRKGRVQPGPARGRPAPQRKGKDSKRDTLEDPFD
jgi:hypothetical protein